MRRITTDIDWNHADTRYWTREESTNNDVALGFTVDGAGEPVQPGAFAEFLVPFDGVITGWELFAQTTATWALDVWKITPDVDAYPPSALDSITGGMAPALIGGTHAKSDDVSAWVVTVARGDLLRFVITDATDLYYGTGALYLARPGVLAAYLPNLDQKADVGHDHDDRYYTEAEIDALLGGLDPAHDHDDRYYTEAEIDALLADVALHTHDERYYPRDDTDNLLAAKANLIHQHAASDVTSGTLHTDRIPPLDAGAIATGVFPLARIPTLDAGRIPSLPASKITSGTFGTGQIPSLDAGKITTGTFGTARIPDLDAGKIVSGQFSMSRLVDLHANKITSGTFAIDRLPVGTAAGTVAAGNHLHDILSLVPWTHRVSTSTSCRVGPATIHSVIGVAPASRAFYRSSWTASSDGFTWYYGLMQNIGWCWIPEVSPFTPL